ncbi:MAG: hypothetical protein R3C26_06800 [Calditrichia bacterium]
MRRITTCWCSMATLGKNALNQAREFVNAVGVNGIVLTSWTALQKAVRLSVLLTLGLPVEYIGVGEGMDDLQPFDAKLYADSLMGQ